MKKLLMVLVLLLYFAITSCSVINNGPDKPPIVFDSAYLNQQIRLVAIKQLSAFQTKYPVAVHLEYVSSNKIVFPSNYNLRIFIQKDSQWLEIKEKPAIRPKDKVILSPSIPISYEQIIMFSPALDDLTKVYFMRIYVFGDMTMSEGTKQVAAFVDFVLSP